MKKKNRLKNQVILIYMAATILMAGILSFYIYAKTYSYTRDALKSNYQNAASLLLNNIESELDGFRSYAYILSRNPSLIRMLLNPYDIYDIVVALNADIEPTIQFILENNDTVKNITIYTDESQKHIPSIYFEDVRTIQDTMWYQQAKTQDGTLCFSEDNDLFVVAPIRNYYSPKIDTGFVKLDIDVDALADSARSRYDNLHFALYTADDEQLFCSLDDPPSNEYVQLSQSELRGTSITSAFYIHKSFFRVPILEILLPILCILAVFLLFSYAFMHFINQLMFRRLEKISDQINSIDADNFIININDTRDDEIGTLAACINHMSEKINHLFTELSVTKDREKRAELEALRARIDPHFLYNIMDTINWIAMDGDTELICTITHELAIFYRTTLNYGNPINTIENEIENVKAYLNLQKIATSQGFDVAYRIDTELLNCETCDFILQPLAENAIVHGIKPLKNRRGVITLELYKEGTSVYLVIADNGVGLNAAVRAGSVFKRTHYGIKNINERIALTFGAEYGVTLAPSPDGIGTIATIKLPYQESQ